MSWFKCGKTEMGKFTGDKNTKSISWCIGNDGKRSCGAGVVISNEQFFIRAKFAVVRPVTNTSNEFPLHIPLDNRTKTTGVILTEHMKCLDVISRNIQFVEKMPEDLLKKTLVYVKAFF